MISYLAYFTILWDLCSCRELSPEVFSSSSSSLFSGSFFSSSLLRFDCTCSNFHPNLQPTEPPSAWQIYTGPPSLQAWGPIAVGHVVDINWGYQGLIRAI